MIARIDWLIADANRIIDEAIAEHFTDHEHVGTVVMVSGGNDSLTLAHACRDRATHIGMANTGIGVEETRQFVRDLAVEWGLPLIERSPDARDSYESFVTRYGFPGPGQHGRMFQSLKERCFRKIRAELVDDGREQRVLFLTGTRLDESARRKRNVVEVDREGSTVYASPIANWTTADMALYRSERDVPRNPVTDHLHMSGECLCGAYAGPGEEDLVRFFYPDALADIERLGWAARENGVPLKKCRWGWGAYAEWDPHQLDLFDSESPCDACSPFAHKMAAAVPVSNPNVNTDG